MAELEVAIWQVVSRALGAPLVARSLPLTSKHRKTIVNRLEEADACGTTR